MILISFCYCLSANNTCWPSVYVLHCFPLFSFCFSHSPFSFYLPSHFHLFLSYIDLYLLTFLPRLALISIPPSYSPSSALIPFLAPSPIPARITPDSPHPYLQSFYPLCYSQAFASQCLFCVRHLGIPIEKVNPYGGAIALGHPLGCSGKNHSETQSFNHSPHFFLCVEITSLVCVARTYIGCTCRQVEIEVNVCY